MGKALFIFHQPPCHKNTLLFEHYTTVFLSQNHHAPKFLPSKTLHGNLPFPKSATPQDFITYVNPSWQFPLSQIYMLPHTIPIKPYMALPLSPNLHAPTHNTYETLHASSPFPKSTCSRTQHLQNSTCQLLLS